MNTPFIVSNNVTVTERRNGRDDSVDLTVSLDLSTNVRRGMHELVTQHEAAPVRDNLVNVGVAKLVRELYGSIHEDSAILAHKLSEVLESPLIEYPEITAILKRLGSAGQTAESVKHGDEKAPAPAVRPESDFRGSKHDIEVWAKRTVEAGMHHIHALNTGASINDPDLATAICYLNGVGVHCPATRRWLTGPVSVRWMGAGRGVVIGVAPHEIG